MSLEKMRRKCQQLTDEERMAILQKATAGTLAKTPGRLKIGKNIEFKLLLKGCTTFLKL